jgi:hypothetical protein
MNSPHLIELAKRADSRLVVGNRSLLLWLQKVCLTSGGCSSFNGSSPATLVSRLGGVIQL